MSRSIWIILVLIILGVGAYLIYQANATPAGNPSLTYPLSTQNTPANSPDNNSPPTSTPNQVTTSPNPASPTAAPVTSANVSIVNFKFVPASLSVKTGTTVTWTNNDTVSHQVNSDKAGQFQSEVLQTGDTYSYTFSQIGSFPYHCGIHPNMKASIIVTK